MKFGVGVLQEVGNHVRTMPVGMLGLEDKAGIFLVAFRGEAHIVELDFVGAGFGCLLSQRDVILLHLGLGRIGRYQLAVFAPGPVRSCATSLPIQDAFPPAAGRGRWRYVQWHACSGECRKWMLLGRSWNALRCAPQQGMVERDGYASIAVLDIKDDSVSAYFTPVFDDANSVIAGGHDAGQIDCTHFKSHAATGTDFSTIGRHGQQSGNDHRLAGLEECTFEISIGCSESPRSVRWKSGKRSARDSGGRPVGCCRRAWLRTGRFPEALPSPGTDQEPWAPVGVDGREVSTSFECLACAKAGDGAGPIVRKANERRRIEVRTMGPS